MLRQILKEIWSDKEGLAFIMNEMFVGFSGMILVFALTFLPALH